MKEKTITIATTVAALMTILVLAVAVSGALVSSQTIPMSGVIASANVGVYSDSLCTQSLTSVNWGTISPGASVNRTVYVKNTGTALITLSMSKTNWNPASANGPISVVWNRESTVLAANQVTTATITLNVSSSVSGIATFGVDVIISGTG